jgi:hypothetical protein
MHLCAYVVAECRQLFDFMRLAAKSAVTDELGVLKQLESLIMRAVHMFWRRSGLMPGKEDNDGS